MKKKRLEIRETLRQLCQWKGVEIIEGAVCPDHIHMLISIPPKMSVSGFMGYYVDTVGKNTKAIKTYISEQLKRNRESDQLSLFDPRNPFMGK